MAHERTTIKSSHLVRAGAWNNWRCICGSRNKELLINKAPRCLRCNRFMLAIHTTPPS